MNIKKLLLNLFSKFMNRSITTKLFVGYFVIVFIPTTTLGYMIFHMNQLSIREQNINSEAHAFDIAKKNLTNQVEQAKGMTSLISTNTSLKKYLSGYYGNISEAVYVNIDSIRPFYDYVVNSNYVLNLSIYGVKTSNIHYFGFIRNVSDFLENNQMKDQSFIDMIFNQLDGLWVLEPDQDSMKLFYYLPIYTNSYSVPLGFIQAEIYVPSIFDSFLPLGEHTYYSTQNGETTFIYQNGQIILTDATTQLEDHKNKLVQTEYLSSLGINAYHTIYFNDFYSGGTITFIIIFILLGSLLFGLYYIIVSLTTKRIVMLNKHIKEASIDKLTTLQVMHYKDEAGSLIISFNQMIERINELIHEVYYNELRSKDAEYYALQAQIKPHFLYNILENIRMVAIENADMKTADMIQLLGKYMRYNLSKNDNVVSLTDELTHAKNYLSIQKIRLNNRLDIKIECWTEINGLECPRFILQPILENTINHGLKTKGTTLINISVYEGTKYDRPNDVVVIIKDNGIGMNTYSLEMVLQMLNENNSIDDHHVGLCNVNHRLKGTWGNSYSINIESEQDKGTVVTLFIKRTN